MANALERYKHKPAGMRAVLRSDEVRRDLLARAERVRDAAEARLGRPLIADSYTGGGRAGATVLGVPLDQERDERILGSAIDAAR